MSLTAMFLLTTLALTPATAAAAEPQGAAVDLGRIDMPNSGVAAAQPAFMRGVLLLHSFEYEDAREAFMEAQSQDPAFVMAYWGEAMTYNHPLWREQDRDAALAALTRLAPTRDARLARTTTPRERGYLEAVEILFGDGDKLARDVAYSAAMEELAASHPGDLEARAFHALSILGTAQGVRDFSIYMRAGAVAEEVFAANPRHPGAAHYMIHSYDDPVHAPLGLRAARVYAQIAPAASHAQHMISHIYVALGRWAESVDANIKSFDVSVARRRHKNLPVDALNYHSLHWLQYSLLQLGRFEEARQHLEAMTKYVQESGSSRALWHNAAMRATWAVETAGRPLPPALRLDETQVTGAAADLFGSGYAAVIAGDLEAAANFASSIGARHETAAAGHLCGQTGSYQDTARTDLVVAQVLHLNLRALIALESGNSTGALQMMEEATAAEESLPLEFGPPAIVKPSHELLGEMFLRLGRPAEAQASFAGALARAPRRTLSLAGLARAAQAAGDAATYQRACTDLGMIRTGADAPLPGPATCGSGTPGEARTAAR